MAASLKLQAYCDESAHPVHPQIFLVVACAAPERTWRQVVEEWTAALEEEGISEHGFHASAIAQKVKPYDGLSAEDVDRIFSRFTAIVAKYPIETVAYSIAETEFARLTVQWQRTPELRRYREPYHLAFQGIIHALGTRLDDMGVGADERVDFTFDEQPKHQRLVTQLHTHLRRDGEPLAHRVGSLAFGDDTEVIPLQVADLVAYVIRRETWRRLSNSGGEPSPHFLTLLNAHKAKWRVHLMTTKAIRTWKRQMEQMMARDLMPAIASTRPKAIAMSMHEHRLLRRLSRGRRIHGRQHPQNWMTFVKRLSRLVSRGWITVQGSGPDIGNLTFVDVRLTDAGREAMERFERGEVRLPVGSQGRVRPFVRYWQTVKGADVQYPRHWGTPTIQGE